MVEWPRQATSEVNMILKNIPAGELSTILRLYCLKDCSPSVEQVYENMPKPIPLISEKEGGNPSDDERDFVYQIAHVWEQDNVRYVLWNDRSLEIHKSSYKTYDYMDKGRYKYRGILLLFDVNDNQTLCALAQHWSKVTRIAEPYNIDHVLERQLPIKFSVTLEEFNQIAAGNGLLPEAFDINMHSNWVEDELKPLTKKSNKIKITEDSIFIEEERYGIEGVKLGSLFPTRFFFQSEMATRHPIAEGLRLVKEHFLEASVCLATPGKYVIHLGKFSMDLRIVESGGKIYRYLGETRIRKDEFQEVLLRTMELEKEEFLKLLENLKKESLFSLEVKEVYVEATDNYYSGEFLEIRFKVERVKREWYASCPADGKKFKVPGGVNTLKKLYAPWVMRGFTVYGAYHELSKIFPKEHVFHMFDTAREELVKANERSSKLLAQTLENNKDRIKEHVESSHGTTMQGYIVKGKRANYFVNKSPVQIFTYPNMQYLCIVEEDYRSILPQNDRMVNRLLLLLNDEDLSKKIATMPRGNYDPDIIEEAF